MSFPRLEDICLKTISTYVLQGKLHTADTKFTSTHSDKIFQLICGTWKAVNSRKIIVQMRNFKLKNIAVNAMMLTTSTADFLHKQNLESVLFNECFSAQFQSSIHSFIPLRLFCELSFNMTTRQNLKVLNVDISAAFDFTHQVIEILFYFDNLETLILPRLEAKQGDVAKIAKSTPNLKCLDLSLGSLNYGLTGLENLKSLEMLVLAKMMKIGDLTAVTMLPNLQVLNFSCNTDSVFSEAPDELSRALQKTPAEVKVFTKLHTLEFSGCLITRGMLDIIVSMMSNLKILILAFGSLDHETIHQYSVRILNFATVPSTTACLNYFSLAADEHYLSKALVAIKTKINDGTLSNSPVKEVEELVDELLNTVEQRMKGKCFYQDFTSVLIALWESNNIPIIPRQTIRLVDILTTRLCNYSMLNWWERTGDADFWKILNSKRMQSTEGVDRMYIFFTALNCFRWNLLDYESILEKNQTELIDGVIDFCLKSENPPVFPIIPDKFRIARDFCKLLDDPSINKTRTSFRKKVSFVAKYLEFLLKFQPVSEDFPSVLMHTLFQMIAIHEL